MEKAGIRANVVVYNAALDACGRAGNPEAAAKILSRMADAGGRGDKAIGGMKEFAIFHNIFLLYFVCVCVCVCMCA